MLQPIIKLALIILRLIDIKSIFKIFTVRYKPNKYASGDIFARFPVNLKIRIGSKLYLLSIKIV